MSKRLYIAKRGSSSLAKRQHQIEAIAGGADIQLGSAKSRWRPHFGFSWLYGAFIAGFDTRWFERSVIVLKGRRRVTLKPGEIRRIKRIIIEVE